MNVLKKLGAAVFVTLMASTTVISIANASSESFAYSDGKKGSSTSLASINSFALLPAPINEDGGGGYGGGGGGTPVVPQYRLLPSLKFEDSWYSYPFSGTTVRVVEAVAYFEQNVGGVWQRVDAQNLNIDCYVNGSFRDRDGESNASKLDVEFDYEGGSVSCNYSANNGAYTSTLTLR